MDTTIRNIDETTYRALKAKAALAGKTVGEVVNEAIRAYLARPDAHARRGSLRELKPERYPKGNERLSEKIDTVVYGLKVIRS
jgi:plasmid stability protein